MSSPGKDYDSSVDGNGNEVIDAAFGAHAVVVTYFPDISRLRLLLDRLKSQVEIIHVIDNTPHDSDLSASLAGISTDVIDIIFNGKNTGIAKALNIGIERALEQGARFVLLSDQDSLPSEDMVARLVSGWLDLSSRGLPVGAIGPTFVDEITGFRSSFQARIPGRVFYGHINPSDSHPIVEALTLITSGTLISSEVLRVVGEMREDFFIDQVDMEWCHRARALGFKLFGTGNASMVHRMGSSALHVWYFGWRNESEYPPQRTYYRVRNFIAMAKMADIAYLWRVRNGWYTLGVVYSQCVFGRCRYASLRMALRGLRHGIEGKMGPLAQK